MNNLRLLKYSLIFFIVHLSAQKQMYKSTMVVDTSKNKKFTSSIVMANNKIVFNADNFVLYAIDKDSYQTVWERKIGWRSNTAPYIFKNTFFYGNYNGSDRKIHQYDIETGKTIRELGIESINTKPHFEKSVMYTTAMNDGGKQIAYDLEKNTVVWQHKINFGADVQPVYLNDRIVVNAEDDLWFEVDFKGNFINKESETFTYIDEMKVTAKKFLFLSHDQTPLTKEWLRKNKLADSEFKIEKNQHYTFVLNEKYLTVIGKKGKKKIQLDLENLISPEEYENQTLSAILNAENKKIWLIHQNHLIHYDVKKEKMLRNVFLGNWRPQQMILDGKNIWLISANDGQLYHLEFEPDENINRIMQETKARQDHLKCDLPNPDKIKAAKAAEEKFKN
ncbi:hypothetical protein NZ698_18560 [Chryseobacterium sp. PBS4-4]|uniref:PQQ-binding-like beta-propeller repeat protein n=1 Tax=Chryseobacterium edaphi TaxID=2976532 RepID=A0ABT2WAG5_9FLAO|nr:hypothetical protein [Chryseobacterium edaphi]MCU7619186.1 hypothetical protein [Chryseobacterium edaphi]